MTPQERAEAAVKAWVDGPRLDRLVSHVAQAICEAVAEEREACARACERENPNHGRDWTEQDGYDQGCIACADAVRARGRGE